MMMLTKPDIPFPVLVYDGECAFCSQTVKMILKADQKKTIRFAAGHSEFAKELLSGGAPESVVLFYKGRVYRKSAAIFETAKLVGGFFYPIAFLRIFPAKWSDAVYDFIARNRYRWFGKSTSCVLPDAYPGRFIA